MSLRLSRNYIVPPLLVVPVAGSNFIVLPVGMGRPLLRIVISYSQGALL